jgi:prepilin-type N-terminal cleavage/methylation domain-containing protein
MLGIKRRGFSIIEVVLVISIIGILSIPIGVLIARNINSTVLTNQELKEQDILNTIMDDITKKLITATKTGGAIDLSTSKKIIFNSYNPQASIGTIPTISNFTYELKSDGLFYKNSVVFPVGLADNSVTNFTFPTGTTKQSLTTAPYFITIRLEAINTAIGTSTILEKTVYLQNY